MSSKSNKLTPADKESFLLIIDLLNEMHIQYWVEGGWGIDVLLGEETREHRDIDIDFDSSVEPKLMEKLSELGYRTIIDERPTRVEMYHDQYAILISIPLISVSQGR